MTLQRLRHYAPALLAWFALSIFWPGSALAAPLPTGNLNPTHASVLQHVPGQVANSASGVLKPATAPHLAPLAAVRSGPHREVFGFALASSLSDPTFGYSTWDFSLVSTVAFFGLHVGDDGRFIADNGWTVWSSSQLSNLLAAAHSYGTKVVLTVILQDFSANTPHMCSGLAHFGATVAEAIAEMEAKGLDGINLDYEGLNGSCGTADPSWARHDFTNFAGSLKAAMPAGSYLSVDTYASSAVDTLGFFDIAGLGGAVDSFFVMAYDLEYSNWARPPAGCSSFCLGPTAPFGAYYYNDNTTVVQYLQVVPASKVVLGVPYYGRKACVASATPNQLPTSAVVADSYLDASTEVSDPAVKPGTYVAHRDVNDPSGQERWDTWYNTSLNCIRELYWDDPTSLGLKYDLVNGYNLRGAGIWNLNYGGGAPELWNELALKFGTTTPWNPLGGVINGSPVVTTVSATRFDVFARGTDNGLWHRWWTGSAWSSWESLGGVMSSGPGAASWSAQRLDVFARGAADGGLWHRSWNGTTWGAWESLGGVLTADPAAVSWGPNRLDVFVRGTDNALWHRAWDGAIWSGWESLGGGLTTGPALASSSANHLDVLVRGTDNALWQRTWDGTSWGKWKLLGGVLTSAPVVISSGSNRLDVFVRSTDNGGGLWQDTWNGTSWSWTSLGGVLASFPGVSSCTAGHFDVFAIGTDGGLWQLGFNGTAWSGWQRLGGQWTANPVAVCPPTTTTTELFGRDLQGAVWQTSVLGS